MYFIILAAIWEQGCGKQRNQPGIDCFAGCGWAADNIPCWELCIVHVCPEDPASEKKEASLQEEVEEGETEARRCSTRRIEHKFVVSVSSTCCEMLS